MSGVQLLRCGDAANPDAPPTAASAWTLQEVSGYIDLGQRLAADPAGMAAVFAGEARLLPQPGDLSSLNWASNRLDSAPSATFEAGGGEEGLGGARGECCA